MRTRIIEFLAHLKIFLATGLGYITDFKIPFLFAVGLKVYFPEASNLFLGVISIIGIIIISFIGWFDLKFIHLAQTTAEISTAKYNPYFTRLEKSIRTKKERFK